MDTLPLDFLFILLALFAAACTGVFIACALRCRRLRRLQHPHRDYLHRDGCRRPV